MGVDNAWSNMMLKQRQWSALLATTVTLLRQFVSQKKLCQIGQIIYIMWSTRLKQLCLFQVESVFHVLNKGLAKS